MPAHGSPQDAHVVSRPVAASDHAAPTNHPLAQRVVSVSPHSQAIPQHPIRELLDQKTVDDCRALAESLAVQREQTEPLIEKLSALAARAGESEAQAAQAVVHLQDRLRLSGQMLKAFQSQIGSIDHSLEQLKAQERRAEAADVRTQQRIVELNARIDAALADFTQRLEHMMHDVCEKMNRLVDERAADAAAHSSDVSPAAQPFMPQTDLHQLAQSMRDVAQQLFTLTAATAAQREVDAKMPLTDEAALSSANSNRAEIYVSPPLRFHTWASRG